MPGDVDAEDTTLYIGFTPARSGCWNSRGCGSFAQSNEGCSYLARWRLSPSAKHGGMPLLANPRRHFGNMPQANPSSYSRFCAFNMMTITARAQTANAHRGTRTPSAAGWLLSPRLTEIRKLNEREKATIWGISHGIVRAIENLRGLRMPLVSRPGAGDCLLP
jgi:hypothetical protein